MEKSKKLENFPVRYISEDDVEKYYNCSDFCHISVPPYHSGIILYNNEIGCYQGERLIVNRKPKQE